MKESSTYLDYAHDKEHMQQYSAYQRKYKNSIRESDKVIIQLIKKCISAGDKIKPISLLDIGCSTGNLLLHIKNKIHGMELTGGDLAEGIIKECKSNPELNDIHFGIMDVLDINNKDKFDFVIANAILCVLNPDEFQKALQSIHQSLKAGGHLIVFDWMHPFEQDLTINEKASVHNGVRFNFRSFSTVKKCLEKAGFINSQFKPFIIPVELKKPDNYRDISSYTIDNMDGSRMTFRGILYQPWCHLVAEKIN